MESWIASDFPFQVAVRWVCWVARWLCWHLILFWLSFTGCYHSQCPSNYPCVPWPGSSKATPEILGIRWSSWLFRMPTMAHSDSDAIVCVPCLRQSLGTEAVYYCCRISINEPLFSSKRQTRVARKKQFILVDEPHHPLQVSSENTHL